MLSSVEAIESTFHNALPVLNGTIQVSAAKGSIGVMVERDGMELGAILAPEQASILANALVTASSACASPRVHEEP